VLASMMSLFEEIFKNFKSSMDELEIYITNSIKEQSEQEINSLKMSLESKEKEIEELKSQKKNLTG
jgi:hypothetical protein